MSVRVSVLPGVLGRWMILLPWALAGCTYQPPPDPSFAVEVKIKGDDGQAIGAAQLNIDGRSYVTDALGLVTVEGLNGPVAGIASASGYLSEPVMLGWEDAAKPVEVRLFDRKNGRRWVLHATGDAMFGRRFEEPVSGPPLIPAGDASRGAKKVVSRIREVYRAADFRTLNLETTVSTLGPEDAYFGKRFILNSRPGTLAALQDLEVDAVLLANNHTRDYKEEGLRQTLDALDAYAFKHLGASVNATDAYKPLITAVNDLQVGLLTYTSVTGSFVNNSYPAADLPMPADLPPEEVWQYEQRVWSFAGETWDVPAKPRRIRTVWGMFASRESGLSEEETAAAWASLVKVYPEMQDWVARRGHGGAAMWRSSEARAAIAKLKQQTDVVIVQLHSGFQYQEAGSESLQRNARTAIDAGADIVICHHPHVLQGVEWYKGKFIAYSLGNFVFDQDFLATFSTAFLRVVWEDDRPIQVRLIPVEIIDYQPTPVVGKAAQRTALRVWEMSMMGAGAARDPDDNGVKAFVGEQDADTRRPGFVLDRHTAVITPVENAQTRLQRGVAAGQRAAMAHEGLVSANLGLAKTDADIYIGRDIFGWGDFEDLAADRAIDQGTHWRTSGRYKQTVVGDAAQGRGMLQLSRRPDHSVFTLIRPVARIPFRSHRLFERTPDGAVSLDPPPSYSLEFSARLQGSAVASTRFDIYEFDDTNPTEDPESVLVNSVSLPFEAGADWQRVVVPITEEMLSSGQVTGNMLNFYFVLDPPPSGRTAVLEIDAVEFIEWRLAGQMPERFGAYQWIRNDSATDLQLDFSALVP